MSSGEVSRRTRTTFSPRSAHSLASSAEKTILPEAAPGEAPRALPMMAAFFRASASNWGCSRVSRERGSIMATACFSSIMPSSTRSQAIFRAAAGVRFAVTGLEHIELAVLHGELHVLHIVIMVLQGLADTLKLLEGLGELLSHLSDGHGVRTPATTSSPWALVRNSPKSFFSPVAGLRVKATPVPQSSPMLPKAMDCTLTAVPQE